MGNTVTYEPEPCANCDGDGVVGTGYDCPACRGSGRATVLLPTAPEEECSSCETHRKLVADRPEFAGNYPEGVPRCVFHQLRRGSELDIIALRRELAT